jgi:hypothetical protein
LGDPAGDSKAICTVVALIGVAQKLLGEDPGARAARAARSNFQSAC